jgi:hypothetical protein
LVARSQDGPDNDDNLITLCVECHGKIHGIVWQNNHKQLIQDGIQRARARGSSHGCKTYAEREPELVAAAKELAAQEPPPSLRMISDALARRGFLSRRGRPYGMDGISKMIGPRCRSHHR